jgi:hypothetical protein
MGEDPRLIDDRPRAFTAFSLSARCAASASYRFERVSRPFMSLTLTLDSDPISHDVPARGRDPSAVRPQSVHSAAIRAASTAFWLAMRSPTTFAPVTGCASMRLRPSMRRATGARNDLK